MQYDTYDGSRLIISLHTFRCMEDVACAEVWPMRQLELPAPVPAVDVASSVAPAATHHARTLAREAAHFGARKMCTHQHPHQHPRPYRVLLTRTQGAPRHGAPVRSAATYALVLSCQCRRHMFEAVMVQNIAVRAQYLNAPPNLPPPLHWQPTSAPALAGRGKERASVGAGLDWPTGGRTSLAVIRDCRGTGLASLRLRPTARPNPAEY
jgi:hypothetical protein